MPFPFSLHRFCSTHMHAVIPILTLPFILMLPVFSPFQLSTSLRMSFFFFHSAFTQLSAKLPIHSLLLSLTSLLTSFIHDIIACSIFLLLWDIPLKLVLIYCLLFSSTASFLYSFHHALQLLLSLSAVQSQTKVGCIS